MIELLPTTDFDTAGIPPTLNVTPIYGSFKSTGPITTLQQLVQNITAFLYLHPECPFEDEQTHDFGNLEAAGPVTSQEANDVLIRIASHDCAYGGPLTAPPGEKDTTSLARATFWSMQGGTIDPKATWYASTDINVCQRVCPSYFCSPYIADWISFLVICLRGDGRTCSVLLGGDTD